MNSILIPWLIFVSFLLGALFSMIRSFYLKHIAKCLDYRFTTTESIGLFVFKVLEKKLRLLDKEGKHYNILVKARRFHLVSRVFMFISMLSFMVLIIWVFVKIMGLN